MPDINLTTISPVTDDRAARLVSPAAFTELSRQITATPLTSGLSAASEAAGHRRSGKRSLRRWLLVGVPLAAAGGAAAMLVPVLSPGNAGTSQNAGAGPARTGTAKVQALAFTRQDGYIKVIVRNPVEDMKYYTAEFARHHLHIKLRLVPASPSIVGTLVYSEGGSSQIKTITAKGRCFTGGAGSECPVGLEVPVSYHGTATFVFGRAARPGEQYESTASVFAPGEALAGLQSQFIGQQVSRVRALLAEHHLTVGVGHSIINNLGRSFKPSAIPNDSHVTGIDPWAPGKVMVSFGLNPADPNTPTPIPLPKQKVYGRTPVASPAATGS